MSSPIYQVKIDLQHVRRQYHAYLHCSDTPILRAYLYLNGKQWVPPTGWTSQLGFGTDFEDSESLIIVDGTIGTGTPANYFDFDMSAQNISVAGDFFSQIIIKNPTDTEQYVFGDGTLHILPSPISGEYTQSVFEQIVNWDLVESTGTVPWPDRTEVITVDCADSPISIDSDDAGKTWVVPSTCSQGVVLILPATTTASNGAVFKFVNQSAEVLTVRSIDPDYIDEIVPGNAIYSGEGGVNDNDPYASLRVKQLSVENYHCVHGRLKWTYIN